MNDNSFEDFFNSIYCSGSLVEFRTWGVHESYGCLRKVSRNGASYAGWYDDYDNLYADCCRLTEATGYLTINPVQSSFKQVCYNQIKRNKITARNEDIQFINYILIDIDPISRPGDASSTASELDATIKARDAILDGEDIRECSMWGTSGNGATILVAPEDKENSPENLLRIKEYLYYLNQKYKLPNAQVDFNTFHANSLVSIPGFLKCKGINSPERPWRAASFEKTSVSQRFKITNKYRLQIPSRSAGSEHNQAYLRKAIDSEIASVEISCDGGRNAALNRAAFNLGQWVGGGYLTKNQVMTWLLGAAEKIGLDRSESKTTINSGMYKGLTRPRSLPEDRPFADAAQKPQNGHWQIQAVPAAAPPNGEEEPPRGDGAEAEDDGETPPGGTSLDDFYTYLDEPGRIEKLAALKQKDVFQYEKYVESIKYMPGFNRRKLDLFVKQWIKENSKREEKKSKPKESRIWEEGTEANPERLARTYLVNEKSEITDPGEQFLALKTWNKMFYEYRNNCYEQVSNESIHKEVTLFMEKEFSSIYEDRLRENGDSDKKPILESVTMQRLANVVNSIRAKTGIEIQYMPHWFTDSPPYGWQSSDMLLFKNKLVHLPSFASGIHPYSCDPTPFFFSTFQLPYEFNPDAPKPTRWFEFLESIFPGDDQSKESLQEWFGYLLTTDTSLQKILMLYGATRSGKGTTSKVLSGLVGSRNVTNPSIQSFGGEFGLQALVGKSVAIFDEVKISRYNNLAENTISNILAISGESPRTINRKHIGFIETKLDVRFVIIGNGIPDLTENSGALAARMIPLHFKQSFVGREDPCLLNKLLEDLPGILLWAIEGWKRLHDRGYFLVPDESKSIVDDILEISAPIQSFVDDCIETNDSHEILVKDAYQCWMGWCGEQGMHPSSRSRFGVWLKSAIPNLKKARKGNMNREWYYKGIKIKSGVTMPPMYSIQIEENLDRD